MLKSSSVLSVVLALTGFATSTLAQTIVIPDPGLDAVVRETLNKPVGPLIQQDMLTLTVLNAHDRNISNLAGLETARNLNTLLLFNNHLTNFSLPTLTNLVVLDLNGNSLTNVSLPAGMTNLSQLLCGNNKLAQFTLPADLTGLIEVGLATNQLTSFSVPALSKLEVLDLTGNLLTNLSLATGLTNLFELDCGDNRLAQLTLPADLTGLFELALGNNKFASFDLPPSLTNLGFLGLEFNALTEFSLPDGLIYMETLRLSGNMLTNFNVPTNLIQLTHLSLDQNQITNFTLPTGLTNLEVLNLSINRLTSLNLPAETTNLVSLRLNGNRLTNVVLPPNLNWLITLDLDFNLLENLNLPAGLIRLENLFLIANRLTGLTIPPDMTNLNFLDLDANQLLSFTLPPGLTELRTLRLGANRLGSFTLPRGLTNLNVLAISENQLTNLTLPSDLFNVSLLDLGENPLGNFTFPSGLINLSDVDLGFSQLTSLTLPPDLTNLNSIFLGGNPLTTFVLPDILAASNLAATVADLKNQGVQVYEYPLTVRLTFPQQQPIGAFRFGITGPPGFYRVHSSTNLASWSMLDVVSNPLGGIFFTDTTAHFSPQKFYRAELITSPPASMVFIPANTFMLGSPTNEVGHQSDESPQTLVTLSHGFWIGKYEVTQREYLAVTGENPAGFPGDLNRPIESVSFFAASNYCFQLTQQDLAAGRIAPGTRYRLPTEAEWECAARAGSTDRFYHGDDPALTNLSNYAWFGALNGITTHPVGQKLPNAWGLYDMEGNVWEWCQDWYGNYPGGAVTDPQGPATNPIGFKVIRGGAWEASEFDCRSASRWFEGASPFISDFIIGFRVVLVTD